MLTQINQMIGVSEAEQIIEESLPEYGTRNCQLSEAYGEVSAEDVIADRDFPPAHKSLMDGIAVSFKAFESSVREFTIRGIQRAGIDRINLKSDHECVEIMTGAILPDQCDVVIPVEEISVSEDKAVVNEGYSVTVWQYIQKQGSQQRKGDTVVKKNSKILAPEISICASVGKSTLSVKQKPKVAVISTGDEVKEIEADVKEYEIRRSNSIFLKVAIESITGSSCDIYHFNDDEDLITDELAKIIESYDIIVMTGGVSMGKFDFVPQALEKNGVEVLFHKVRQKPGKPMWYGKTENGKLVFALPGNPVATQVGCYKYVIPAIWKALGLKTEELTLQVTREVEIPTELTFFLPFKLCGNKAEPMLFQGSSDLASLSETDGFLEIEEEGKVTDVNKQYKAYFWKGQ